MTNFKTHAPTAGDNHVCSKSFREAFLSELPEKLRSGIRPTDTRKAAHFLGSNYRARSVTLGQAALVSVFTAATAIGPRADGSPNLAVDLMESYPICPEEYSGMPMSQVLERMAIGLEGSQEWKAVIGAVQIAASTTRASASEHLMTVGSACFHLHKLLPSLSRGEIVSRVNKRLGRADGYGCLLSEEETAVFRRLTSVGLEVARAATPDLSLLPRISTFAAVREYIGARGFLSTGGRTTEGLRKLANVDPVARKLIRPDCARLIIAAASRRDWLMQVRVEMMIGGSCLNNEAPNPKKRDILPLWSFLPEAWKVNELDRAACANPTEVEEVAQRRQS